MEQRLIRTRGVVEDGPLDHQQEVLLSAIETVSQDLSRLFVAEPAVQKAGKSQQESRAPAQILHGWDAVASRPIGVLPAKMLSTH
jgi:hypothetical protein